MKAVMLPHIKRRRRMMQCLALSIAAHTVALSYFYFHPLILQGPFQSLFGITSIEPTPIAEGENDSTLLQKNQLLEEAFQSIVVLSPHLQRPYDMVELAKGVSLAPHSEEDRDLFLVEESELEFLKPLKVFSASVSTEALDAGEPSPLALFQAADLNTPITSALQVDATMVLPEFSFKKNPMSEEAVDEDFAVASTVSLEASYELDDTLLLTVQNISTDSTLIAKDLTIQTDAKALTTNIATEALVLSHETALPPLFVPPAVRLARPFKQIPIAQEVAPLEEYPFSDPSVAAEWNDDFDVDVTFLPHPEGKGYIFSLSLKSNYDLSSHGLKQNLYFVLDRSSSVQKHRFAVFKRATLKALSSMQRSDTFNILLIDKKIALFSPENRTATLKNISAAEAFLDKQEAGGFFASSDIYTKLDQLLPHIPDNDEMHTVLLLTDGKTEMQAARKQKTLNKWIEKNREKVVLHACAIGKNNDLLSLDMLCSVSGGNLLYSDTHAAFPRKLARLIMDLTDPVAKELSLTTLPHHPDSHIELYPANTPLTPLYAHQPYVILGQIDHPCSFDLVLQGRHRDQWIAIKKTISFIDGRKGDITLQKQWKSQQAGTCYSHFLKEGKAAHLQEAREILKQSRSEVAFE